MPRASSIQGSGHKRGYKSSTARLNDKTLATADRRGMRIEGSDFATVIRMRKADKSIMETAIVLRRTYYGTQALFAATGLVMRCFPEIAAAIEESNEMSARKLRKQLAQAI